MCLFRRNRILFERRKTIKNKNTLEEIQLTRLNFVFQIAQEDGKNQRKAIDFFNLLLFLIFQLFLFVFYYFFIY